MNPMITRRSFLRKAAIAGVMAGAGGFGAAYPFFIEPFWVSVRTITLNPKPSFRFVFVSDLHFSDLVTAAYLEKSFARIVSLDPDFVVLGGDYITGGSSRFISGLVPLMSGLARVIPTYGVLGNHDYEISTFHQNRHRDEVHIRVTSALLKSGVRMLINEHAVIEANGQKLTLAGVDDLWAGRTELDRAFAGNPSILVAHNPDLIPDIHYEQPLLMLCGHTHGGQVWLPGGIGAPVVPVKHREFTYGLIRRKQLTAYITSGLGYLWPGRFLVRPEIVLFQI